MKSGSRIAAFLVLSLATAACTGIDRTTPTAMLQIELPTIAASETPTVTRISASTEIPTITPTLMTPTPTQALVYAAPKMHDSRCYYRPIDLVDIDIKFVTMTWLLKGDKAQVYAQLNDHKWWLIKMPTHGKYFPTMTEPWLLPYRSSKQTATPTPVWQGEACWVRAEDVNISGETDALPVLVCYERTSSINSHYSRYVCEIKKS